MNILVTSVGSRNLVVRSFKEAFTGIGNVITTDIQNTAPALYEADKHYLVPSVDDPKYIKSIIDICIAEKIDGLLSLIDPELPLLAAHEDEMSNIGVTVIGSSRYLCDVSFDKYLMYKVMSENNIHCARTYIVWEDWHKKYLSGKESLPVYVKPRKGSASKNVFLLTNIKDVEQTFRTYPDMLIQEELQGDEYGADLYIDMISGKTVRCFIKRKLLMRAGETDKSVSVVDSKLTNQLMTIVENMGFKGPLDIDFFVKDGFVYISEINTRFGGGYVHPLCLGINYADLILENLRGNTNEPLFNQYDDGVYMMKYSEVILCDKDFNRIH